LQQPSAYFILARLGKKALGFLSAGRAWGPSEHGASTAMGDKKASPKKAGGGKPGK